jgi:hypothetical protein
LNRATGALNILNARSALNVAKRLSTLLNSALAPLNRPKGFTRAAGALPAALLLYTAPQAHYPPEGPIIYATTEFQQESWGTTRTGGVPEDRQATAVDTDQTAAAGDEAL